MSKKQIITQYNITHTHGECGHCVPYLKNHLDCNGRPLLGKCKYSAVMLLLSEKTNCIHYDKRKENSSR